MKLYEQDFFDRLGYIYDQGQRLVHTGDLSKRRQELLVEDTGIVGRFVTAAGALVKLFTHSYVKKLEEKMMLSTQYEELAERILLEPNATGIYVPEGSESLPLKTVKDVFMDVRAIGIPCALMARKIVDKRPNSVSFERAVMDTLNREVRALVSVPDQTAQMPHLIQHSRSSLMDITRG